MSEIRDIPDVKDASGIFKFDASKKAIIVPISAIEGLEKYWVDYSNETGTAILPYNRCEHDEELEKLLQPTRPLGAEFARKAEAQIFRSMLEWKVWKIYVWDDFNSDGSNARWDWCFGPVRPENKACREHSFANLIVMDDWHFERFVRTLPPSPNEGLVRKWREELRKDPLNVQAAKYEATPMDWSELEYDPDLIKKVLL